MTEFVTTLVEATVDNTSHEGPLVDTAVFPVIDRDLRPQLTKRELKSETAKFTLSATTVTTSGIGVITSLWVEIDGVDHKIGTFTIRTAAGVQTIDIAFCPRHVKVKTVATDTTVYVASVHCVRF